MASSPSALTIKPGLDQLRISVRGVPDPRATSDLLDGPVDASASVTPPANAAAVSAGVAQAQDQEKAVALGLAAATGEAVPPAEAQAHRNDKGIHPVVFDASEGTPFDPLLDKTYDLNYPKTVPTSPASP